ncbi:hypothetical protein EMCRGX_G001509 [Ephydatia muelleri]
MDKLLLVLLIALDVTSSVLALKGTVLFSSTQPHYTFVPDVIDHQNGAVYGSYDDSTSNTTGWGVLNIAAGYSNNTMTDYQLAMAAGVLEGALTQSDTYYNFVNLNYTFFDGCTVHEVKKVKEFLETQRTWMVEMMSSNQSAYWYYMGLIYAQFEGLVYGYNMVAPPNQQLDTFAFDFLCGGGDFWDILSYISPGRRPDLATMSKEELDFYLASGHCSALIKVLPGYEDVFAAHSTWAEYATMMRTFKHYSFNLRDQRAASKVTSFSGYPGLLSSTDDYYVMDSGLIVIETTNDILNNTLFEAVTPKALLSWHRMRLANWLATGGEQWAGYFSEYNSGTYNNQYMVLDLKKITLKSDIADDALWIVEQIPGYVASGDQTPILRTGYWASYNTPFYEYVYNVSGYPELVKKYGPEYSYQLAPRAKIFRRDESNVTDLESFGYLMRSNNYKQDPYSQKDPMNAICSRGDLQHQPYAGGCIDTKMTDYNSGLSLTTYAENGPTHQGLAPFDWNAVPQFNDILHFDQPTVFDFGFVEMKPQFSYD